jgi:dethiobiotin synthetase
LINAAGLQLAAWVANRIDPQMQLIEANIETLRLRLGCAPIADVPYAATLAPAPRLDGAVNDGSHPQWADVAVAALLAGATQ